MDFIPTIEDWKEFLKKWNQAIFDNLDQEHRKNYELQYPDVLLAITSVFICG